MDACRFQRLHHHSVTMNCFAAHKQRHCLGPDYYERQRGVRRQVAHHVGKLGALGFEVTLCRIPEPEPDTTGPAQAA